jgi:hypothetical protein
MKITLGQLRSLIREMAFEKISKVTDTFDHWEDYDPDDRDEEIEKEIQDDIKYREKKKEKLDKYFSSKKWSGDASNLYKFIKAPIWIIPDMNEAVTSGDMRHVEILSLEEAMPSIEQSDFMPEEVEAHLNAGGCVLIIGANDMRQNEWPSPWMVLHAIFDYAEVYNDSVGDFYRKNIDIIRSSVEELEESYPRFWNILVSSMTMKSARDGKIGSERDAAAELLVQSIALRNGCRIKQLSDELIAKYNIPLEDIDLINGKLMELENEVNSLNMKELINDLFTGNILRFEVSSQG